MFILVKLCKYNGTGIPIYNYTVNKYINIQYVHYIQYGEVIHTKVN